MGFANIKAWDEGEEVTRPDKNMIFVSLHHHTTFSYQDGYGTPKQHVYRVAELGGTHLALAEHGNVTSHVQLEQAALQVGVTPIFGSELYCGEVGEGATRRKNHLTVLAETDEGYRNLLRLVSRAWAEGFYYEPTASGAMLREHSEGLVVLSGCTGSLLATSLVGGKNVPEDEASYERGRAVAQRMFGVLDDSYYLEVQAFPELEKVCRINQALAQISEELGIPLVATLDAHYMYPEESELQAILHNVRPGNKKTLEEQARTWSRDVKLCPLTDREIFLKLRATGLTKRQAEQAIRNTRVIAERCKVTLPKVENVRYPLAGTGATDNVQLFRRWINEGWHYRGFGSLPFAEHQRYVEQAKYEMGLIQDKGFIDYFLMVADIVKFAKDYRGPEAPYGIPVGPARGSAAASLVCYLMRITEVNPMLFPTLLFERFIDVNRHDLPDIDLDFDDELRYLVYNYACEKYGADRVGNIATFVKYKGKNSLDDVQRAEYKDNWSCVEDVKTVKGLLIERMSGDLRANATIEDSMEMFPQVKEIFERWPLLLRATELEGNVKGMSVHAAGLVIANEPLSNFCAVYTRTDKDGNTKSAVSLDKHDAEYLNVLKLDALGLKTMAMIRICLEQIGMTLEELYAIPLDDEDTIQGFKNQDIVGVFQFDGRAMQNVNGGVQPDNFIEVCDINALARPGPLHSGATGEYIDVKHGRKTPLHYHDIVDEITQYTQYQIVYQEQILQVVRRLGGFSWEEAARIRKIISKKRGEQEFNTMRAKFIAGAATHGMDEADADRVFSMLATAGAYAFNAAHCISYGLLAYWTMWLKQHYPKEFFVAALRKYGEIKKSRLAKRFEDKRNYLLRDAIAHGIRIGSVSLNYSQVSWSIEGDAIIPGFQQIKGIGEKSAPWIVNYRDDVGWLDDWDDLLNIKGIGPKTVESVVEFSERDDPFGLHVLKDKLDPVRKLLTGGVTVQDEYWHEYDLPLPTHCSEEVPYDRSDGDVEVVWLGVIRDRNTKDLFELHHSRTGEHLDPSTVKRPELKDWLVMTGEDETDVLVITIDRWRWPKFKKEAWDLRLDEDVVLIRGLKKGFQARRAIYVTDWWILEMEDDEEEEELDDDDGE